jgi:hypothetical protein
LTADDLFGMSALPDPDVEGVCHEIEQHLKKLVVEHCEQTISDDAFLCAVLEIEAREVRPHGLTLTASRTRDHWTVFQIKKDGTNDLCAAFEFQPQTGEFRRGCS